MFIRNVRLFLVTLLVSLLISLTAPTNLQASSITPAEFADKNFFTNWQRTDFPILEGKATRSWYWGPKPLGSGLLEEYANAKPYNRRVVQYFDKARMEINDSTRPAAVTNGLLVVEMITGRLQKGDKSFEDKGGGARIPIAGDPDNVRPTYADLSRVYNLSLKVQPGEIAQTALNKDSFGSQNSYSQDELTKIAIIRNNLGVPVAFWNFLNNTGQVYENGEYRSGVVSDWLSSTGLPITEAFWVKVRVAGVEKDVLFQAFERRLLTYTPANPVDFKVEMGNVGVHYVNWRYQGNLPTYSNNLATIFTGVQPDWYEVTTEGLNIRTGPATTFPYPTRTESFPILTQLVMGNRIQPLRQVKGEKLLGENDIWFQFYEGPDLYVYSGYLKKLTLPDLPAPTITYNGLWVAVSLDKQMAGVYDGSRLLYRTLISSGRTNSADPTKDYRTPKGSFRIDGSFRPKSQTMEGGNRASADFYRLEKVQNVSYFYLDNGFHGTYWHSRFGTVPQSRGCINMTVYDAGLIYQLKAGTQVLVY